MADKTPIPNRIVYREYNTGAVVTLTTPGHVGVPPPTIEFFTGAITGGRRFDYDVLPSDGLRVVPMVDDDTRREVEELIGRLKLRTPYGAYERWSRTGETADAAELDYWEHLIERVAALLATYVLGEGET